jgi:hypothetical protein
MVMPRVLSIGPGPTLRQRVPTEFSRLRGMVTTLSNIRLAQRAQVLEGIPPDAVEIEAMFAVRGFTAFGFELRRSASEAPAAAIVIQRGHLSVGSARAYIGQADRYTVRLFLDRRCLEVYVNDGTVALYSALNAVPADRVLALFARAPGSTSGALRLVVTRRRSSNRSARGRSHRHRSAWKDSRSDRAFGMTDTNARLVTETPVNAHVLRASLVAALGGLLFGFDTAVIAGTMRSRSAARLPGAGPRSSASARSAASRSAPRRWWARSTSPRSPRRPGAGGW